MENTNSNIGLIEKLGERIRTLMAESQDPLYTEYLQKLQNRLIQQKYQVDLIASDLDRSYQLYQQRIASRQKPVETGVVASVTEAIQPVEEAEECLPTVETEERLPVVEASESIRQAGAHKNTEFTVGAAVLSVVGGGFILAALVTLGMMFMGGLFKGMCLYAISAAFLVTSELVIYRRWPMLGATMSSIGIGGMYLSTILNYVSLHNFNLWVTLVIGLVISVFVAWLSRKRESVLYRIMGIVAGYIVFFVIDYGITSAEFVVVSVMLLLMNTVFIIWPAGNKGRALTITHMAVNTFFAFLFLFKAEETCYLYGVSLYVFIVTSMLVVLILFVKQMFAEKTCGKAGLGFGVPFTYYICMFWYGLLMCSYTADVIEVYSFDGFGYISMLIAGLIGLGAALVLWLGKCAGIQHIYSFINIMTLCVLRADLPEWSFVIGLVVLYLLSKLLSMKKNLTLQINSLVLTVWVCGVLLFGDSEFVYVMLTAILLGILLIRNWQTCYEMIFTFTLAIYAAVELPGMLQLPVCVGILLLGVLAFNNVKRWKGKQIHIYNYIVLAAQTLCYLCLAFSEYRESYLVYIFMLVLGLATIVLTFQEKYRMEFRAKYIIFAGFLTYMALLLKTEIPVINSILLMIIALVCVGLGFAKKSKSVRIYGLSLSLFVCGKLILYDFFQAATVQKIIVFAVVGIIALLIASIYIILEKRNDAS